MRRLPLQCRRPPWIATRKLSLEQAPDKIEQEYHLGETHGQRRHGDEGIQRMGRWRDERHFANVVIAAWDSEQPKIMHGKEDQVGPDKGTPEMTFAESVVEHPPRDFGVPMIDRPQDNHDWRHTHHHMEMRYNLILRMRAGETLVTRGPGPDAGAS